jgi:uncharacterized protein YkwD
MAAPYKPRNEDLQATALSLITKGRKKKTAKQLATNETIEDMVETA